MEGVTGVAAAGDVTAGRPSYDDGQSLLVRDVNAAVEGAIVGGATSVLVNDSHASMTNLRSSALHEKARLIRGNTKPRSMMQGLQTTHDVALFVGYHAMAGTAGAVLNHTFLSHELVRLRVCDQEVGELGWNARMAGAHAVPVGLVTGDDKTVAEARNEVGETLQTATVKRGIDRFSADCRPPEETRSAIRDAAEAAVERAHTEDLDIIEPPDPVHIEADWAATNHAARAASTPGVERKGDRTTGVSAEDYPAAYEATVGMLRAGAAGRNELFG